MGIPVDTDRWLTETTPASLVQTVYGKGASAARRGVPYDPERLRIYACACCRVLWNLLDDDHRQAVTLVEDYLHTPTTTGLLQARKTYRAAVARLMQEWDTLWGTDWGAYGLVREFSQGVDPWWRWYERQSGRARMGLAERLECTARCFAASAVWKAAEKKPTTAAFACTNAGRALVYKDAVTSTRAGNPPRRLPYYPHYSGPDENSALCDLLREIIVNPHAPVTLNAACRTPVVVALAQAAWDHWILPSGQLEGDRLLVLADALEDAEADPGILAHLRTPGPHVRGCWALDLVLGREAPNV
jgi:hypothetical protein